MSSKTLLLFLFWTLSNMVLGQNLFIGVAYQNLYAKQWNEANQVYNYTRPFLSRQQPNLTHGIQTEIGYYLKSNRDAQHGISIAYNWHRSTAENENFKSTQHFHLIQPGYFREFHKINRDKGFVAQVGLSLTLGGLYRKINDAPLIYDEASAKAFGIGGSLKAHIAYLFSNSSRLKWKPFLGFNYTPFYYAPKTEAIINQTTGLIIKDWSSLFSAQLGLKINL